MKQFSNDTPIDHEETSKRRSPVTQRVLVVLLIVMSCLAIVSGLLTGVSSSFVLSELGPVGTIVTIVVYYSLLKNNPHLRKASRLSWQSIIQPGRGLDEREKLVLDQAFRISYGIIALIVWFVCVLGFVWFFILRHLHLTYHIDQSGFAVMATGTIFLLVYLPTAVVAWKEER